MASAVSQPWDAGSEADQLVSLYVSDANLMALVELGKVPTDGSWEGHARQGDGRYRMEPSGGWAVPRRSVDGFDACRSPADRERQRVSFFEAGRLLVVVDLAAEDAHLYLWTTNAYLHAAFDIASGWGFKHSQTLTWCKPRNGIGPGGAFSNTTEFVLFCRRGHLAYQDRLDTTWWQWPRGAHSVKPAAFYDLVERVSPGPYVELFARAPRLGWSSWGLGSEAAVKS
jgi:N6-adenosine-specific RNA methylase IME4